MPDTGSVEVVCTEIQCPRCGAVMRPAEEYGVGNSREEIARAAAHFIATHGRACSVKEADAGHR